MKDGVIADFTYTEKMLQYFIGKVHGNRVLKPRRACWCACRSVDAGRTPRHQGVGRRRRRPQRADS
jgi:hypothetical protein